VSLKYGRIPIMIFLVPHHEAQALDLRVGSVTSLVLRKTLPRGKNGGNMGIVTSKYAQ